MDCSTFAFDLHVLGTPPALILSQDQTLKLKWFRLRAPRCSETCAPPHAASSSENFLTRSPVDLALGFNPPSPSLALELRRTRLSMDGPSGTLTRAGEPPADT